MLLLLGMTKVSLLTFHVKARSGNLASASDELVTFLEVLPRWLKLSVLDEREGEKTCFPKLTHPVRKLLAARRQRCLRCSCFQRLAVAGDDPGAMALQGFEGT